LVGVAVKLTFALVHIDVALAEIDIDAVTGEVNIITTLLDVALAGDTHDALDVITHHTESLFANVVVENVDAFVPTLFPFTFH
jgi:hypothetical protein